MSNKEITVDEILQRIQHKLTEKNNHEAVEETSAPDKENYFTDETAKDETVQEEVKIEEAPSINIKKEDRKLDIAPIEKKELTQEEIHEKTKDEISDEIIKDLDKPKRDFIVNLTEDMIVEKSKVGVNVQKIKLNETQNELFSHFIASAMSKDLTLAYLEGKIEKWLKENVNDILSKLD